MLKKQLCKLQPCLVYDTENVQTEAIAKGELRKPLGNWRQLNSTISTVKSQVRICQKSLLRSTLSQRTEVHVQTHFSMNLNPLVFRAKQPSDQGTQYPVLQSSAFRALLLSTSQQTFSCFLNL